jgi:hypothetical protein
MSFLTPLQLHYPVLMLGAQFTDVMLCPDDLTKCSVGALKNDVFKKCAYIDAQGNVLANSMTKFTGYVGPLWGFRLMRTRYVTVDLSFEKKGEMTLDQVKQLLLQDAEKIRRGVEKGWAESVISPATSLAELFYAIK